MEEDRSSKGLIWAPVDLSAQDVGGSEYVSLCLLWTLTQESQEVSVHGPGMHIL